MATRVQIAFNLSANGVGDYFTLDDATKGVLDNATYKLGGDVLVDVTAKVRSVQVRRGRSRQLERFTAGNANIVLDNRDRSFDPLNAASAYYGSILPGKQVIIDRDGATIYTGAIFDWNFDYDLSNDSTAQVSAVDGLSLIAQQTRTAGTATSQLTGARVSAVLTEVGWPVAQRSISAGQATLDADVVAPDTNALAYLSQVADVSEPGAIFIGKTGLATFRDRADLQAFTSGLTFGIGGIPVQEIRVDYGAEQLANAISVTYTAGTVVAGTATADDATSQAAYGVVDKSIATFLSSSAQASALATWQLGQYKDPVYRFDAITVNLLRLSSSEAAQVLALELADVVLVTWTPNSVGSAISEYVGIEQIEHAISPDTHTVTFTLSQAALGFVLDSATFGVLDTSLLGL